MSKPMNIQAEKLSGFLTAPEIAARLGVSKQAVHKMMSRGLIGPIYYLGPDDARQCYVVPTGKVDEFIELRTSGQSTLEDLLG